MNRKQPEIIKLKRAKHLDVIADKYSQKRRTQSSVKVITVVLAIGKLNPRRKNKKD